MSGVLCFLLTVNRDDPYCDPPPLTSHSTLTPHPTHNGRYMAGDSVTYSCASPHIMLEDDDSVIVCLDEGMWSYDAPVCVSKSDS